MENNTDNTSIISINSQQEENIIEAEEIKKSRFAQAIPLERLYVIHRDIESYHNK